MYRVTPKIFFKFIVEKCLRAAISHQPSCLHAILCHDNLLRFVWVYFLCANCKQTTMFLCYNLCLTGKNQTIFRKKKKNLSAFILSLFAKKRNKKFDEIKTNERTKKNIWSQYELLFIIDFYFILLLFLFCDSISVSLSLSIIINLFPMDRINMCCCHM